MLFKDFTEDVNPHQAYRIKNSSAKFKMPNRMKNGKVLPFV